MTSAVVMLAVEVKDESIAREIEAVVATRRARGKAFDGSSDHVITLLIQVVPKILVPLAAILQIVMSRNKDVRVMHNGTEIRGVSEKTLLQLLDHASATPKKRSARPPAGKQPAADKQLSAATNR